MQNCTPLICVKLILSLLSCKEEYADSRDHNAADDEINCSVLTGGNGTGAGAAGAAAVGGAACGAACGVACGVAAVLVVAALVAALVARAL